ncbi:hypothetical protein HELRODRAFT_127347, partial [Helobdella robusta]|uniref:IRF tryptophan pentad repeat domain-containing protein n=1 Tax=Helobdella robusta TaxID=6412 RepID=T1EHE2_HELRO
RQILRPWLEGILNSGGVPGVNWLDNERTQFVIPWPRGSKSCPDQNEKEIFKKWAEHTGRYRVGIDKEDYVRWKTRLRCALNKSKDFEEIIDEEKKHPNHKF